MNGLDAQSGQQKASSPNLVVDEDKAPLVEEAEELTGSEKKPGPVRRLVRYLVRLNGSPEQIAWGLALGLFIAMTPTVGFQMMIAVPVAGALRVNPTAAALGVWLTNPFTIPILYGLNYVVGAFIMGYSIEESFTSDITLDALFHAGPHVIISLLIGGVITGAASAAAAYYPTLYAVRGARAARQRRREKKARRAQSKPPGAQSTPPTI